MSIPKPDIDLLEREKARVAAAHMERAKAAGVDGSQAGSFTPEDPTSGLRRVGAGGLDGGPIGPTGPGGQTTGATTPTHSTAPYRAQGYPEVGGTPNAAPYAPPAAPTPLRPGQAPYEPVHLGAEPDVEPETGRAIVPEDDSLQEFYTFHFIGPEVRVDLDLPDYLGLGPALAVVIPPITTRDQDDMEILSMRYSKLSGQVHNTEDPKQRARHQQRRLQLQEEMAARFMPVFREYPGLFFRMGNDAFNFLWDIVQRMSRGATNAAAREGAIRAARESGTIRPNS